jgi:hypothetical protein
LIHEKATYEQGEHSLQPVSSSKTTSNNEKKLNFLRCDRSLSLARAKWCPPMRRFSPGSVRAFGSSALQVQTLASRCKGSLPGLRTFAYPARSFVLRTLAPQRAFALRSFGLPTSALSAFGLRTFPPPCYELSDSEPSHRSATSLRIPNLPSHCRLSDGHPAPC